MLVKHLKVFTQPDGADATILRPSDWHAVHDVTVSATDKVLGRETAGAGAAEEIACTAAGRALLDDIDAQAQRNTLVLGTADTVQFGNFRSDAAKFAQAVGIGALPASSTGAGNTAVGMSALEDNTTGTDNTCIGYNALSKNTTGIRNMAMGTSALSSNVTGSSNMAIGRFSCRFSTGDNNVAVGSSALAFNTTGGNNVAIGLSALTGTTTGVGNTALGYIAGDSLTTGSGNTIIGASIDAPIATGNNQLTIGNLFFGTAVDGTGTTVSSGNAGVGVAAPGARLHVKGGTAGAVVGIDQGAVSQTADLRQWVNSAGTVLAKVSKDGYLTLPGGLRLLGYVSSAAAPTTTELPTDKDIAIHKDTVGGGLTLAFNEAGTIRKVALT